MASRRPPKQVPTDRVQPSRSMTPAVAASGKQMAQLVADPHSAFFKHARDGYKRGIDFYAGSDLFKVMAIAAHRYRGTHGHYPDMLNPERLTEKILWSNYFRPLKAGEAGNKLATASFIPAEMPVPLALPEVVWRSREARLPPDDAIEPGHYYLKTNHGSDMFRRIAWPPSADERRGLEEEFADHLDRAYGFWTGEWWYSCFEREVFLERSVAMEKHPIAWCCYTFAGKVGLITVYRKTDAGAETAWLRPDFTPERWQNPGKPRTQFAMPAAELREAMLAAANAIGRASPFVRVDFLIGDNGGLYLSEVTFSPGNASTPLPEELDRRIGALYRLGDRAGRRK